MYICISGNFPFHGDSMKEIFKNVLHKDIKIIQDPDLSYLSTEANDLLIQF
jgi:hypothetical protein